MGTHNIGIIMNGVTGRMGTNQHLIRSIIAIQEQGGIKLSDGNIIMPDPILVGRNEAKLQAIAEQYNIKRWSTDLDECLSNPDDQIYFDSQTTVHRTESVKKAIAAGKHIYLLCRSSSPSNRSFAYGEEHRNRRAARRRDRSRFQQRAGGHRRPHRGVVGLPGARLFAARPRCRRFVTRRNWRPT